MAHPHPDHAPAEIKAKRGYLTYRRERQIIEVYPETVQRELFGHRGLFTVPISRKHKIRNKTPMVFLWCSYEKIKSTKTFVCDYGHILQLRPHLGEVARRYVAR